MVTFLGRKMPPGSTGLINFQWGHVLTSLCVTLETSTLKIHKEPHEVVRRITLLGLLAPQFWTFQKEKLTEE